MTLNLDGGSTFQGNNNLVRLTMTSWLTDIINGQGYHLFLIVKFGTVIMSQKRNGNINTRQREYYIFVCCLGTRVFDPATSVLDFFRNMILRIKLM